jgi:hypothetical protein
MEFVQPCEEERGFGEFRRKVRDSQLLSASLEKLLSAIHFTGRVSVVVQNGRVLNPATGGLLPSRPE